MAQNIIYIFIIIAKSTFHLYFSIIKFQSKKHNLKFKKNQKKKEIINLKIKNKNAKHS
jgi:hypothetical protein